MADTPSLKAPRLRVVLQDGTEHEVQADNRDLLQWDRTRAKHRWPSGQEAPFVWLTFLAWHALRREGLTALSLTEFEEAALEVGPAEDEEGAEDGAEDVDPTQEGAEPGSS